MTTFTDPEFPNLAAELDRMKRDTLRLEIGDGVHIIYDKADTWLAISDDDWTSYDRPGGVALGVEQIDTLIEKLQEVKVAIEARLSALESGQVGNPPGGHEA